MAASDARPIPLKNTAYRVIFPILDADGDLVTGATGLDSEVSIDQGTFADCTNEATEIATASGMYYLDLTSSEMNGDCIAVIVKTTSSGAKTTPIVLYPEETGDINVDVTAFGGTAGTFAGGRPETNVSHWLGTAAATPTVAGVPEVDITHIAGSAVSTSSAQLGVNVVNAGGTAWASGAITTASIGTAAINLSKFAGDVGFTSMRSNTAQAGGATSITLDASASATTDFYKYCLIRTTGGTGSGQFRLCTAYDGGTKVATVTPAWATNPDGTTTFTVLPAGIADVEAWHGTATPTEHTAGYPIVTIKDGTGTGEINTNAGAVALVDLVTTLTTYTGNTPQTGDAFARIGAAGAGLTAIPWNASWDAEVQSEVDDALVVHRLDELLNADSDIDGAAPPTVGSVFHELLTKTTGSFTYDQTTDSLEAIRDRGDAAWTTGAGGTNPELLQNTTIATLASQTSFTLTDGSADNDAYNGSRIVITDQTTSTQKAVGVVLDYTGATKTITLANDPAVFTMAVGDTVDILADRSLKPTVDNRTLNVASGRADADLTHIATAAVSTTTAQLGVNTVQAGGTAWGSGAITSGTFTAGAINNSVLNNNVGFKSIRQATAQAGSASTITLDASASATDDFYNNKIVVLTSGTGSVDARRIRDYVGSTKVASITPNWVTNPDNTTAFAIMPSVSAWDEVLTDHLTAGSTGNALNAAGSAGDPWATALPGAYGAGTAGNILGNMTGGSASTLQTTTIATLASQTSFTLTAGSADSSAYNGMLIVVTDASTSTQKAVGIISSYVGSTKTVTLERDPGVFVMAAGDTVNIIAAKFDNRPRRGVALTALEFLMVDATDLKTEETGLAVSASLSKDGGAFSATTNSVTEVGNGVYKITLTATEMDAAQIWLRATATGAANRHVPIFTQP